MNSPKCLGVRIGSVEFGTSTFPVIAGPCSVESEEQFATSLSLAHAAGAACIRGGLKKMRTKPDSFQGLGRDGVPFVLKALKNNPLPFVSEITDPRDLEWMDEVVDAYQIGTRNMYNYDLLKEVGRCKKPVILKRAFSAYIDEWIHAAEYIARTGNTQIILCERGIRSFEPRLRNTLDLGAVAYLKANADFPVIVDPSHATGDRDFVEPMALAAAAAGADGLLIEAHPNPRLAYSDSQQALDFESLGRLMIRLEKLLNSQGRELYRNKGGVISFRKELHT